MFLIDRLAEERIQQSIERGELDNLPGYGQPLALDDDSHVPAELRAAYRLLKNAGYVPAEVLQRREMADLEALLAQSVDAETSHRVRKRLQLLRLQLEGSGKRVMQLWAEPGYREQLLEKLAG